MPKPNLDDFQLVKNIGKGSYGKVMLVKHNIDGALYAMKCLRKEHVIMRNQSERHSSSERNVLECVAHPFIIQMHYAFQTPKKLYIVLDFAAGGELFFHLSRAGRFSEGRCRFYAAEICLALGYLHSLGIVYRDLKPENLVLDAEGHVKLTDFGSSREGVEDKTISASLGSSESLEYTAPELLTRSRYGKSVDWYSFGALIYEMFTGLPPYYTRDRAKLVQRIQQGNLTFPNYFSPEAKQLVAGLMMRDQNKRLGAGFERFYKIDLSEVGDSKVTSLMKKLRNCSADVNSEVPDPCIEVQSSMEGKESSKTEFCPCCGGSGLLSQRMEDNCPLCDGFGMILDEDAAARELVSRQAKDIDMPARQVRCTHDVSATASTSRGTDVACQQNHVQSAVRFIDDDGDAVSFFVANNVLHKSINGLEGNEVHKLHMEPIEGWGWFLEDQNESATSMPAECLKAFSSVAELANLQCKPSCDMVARANSTTARQEDPNSATRVSSLSLVFPYQGSIDAVEDRAMSLGQLMRVMRFARLHCPHWTETSSHSKVPFGKRLSLKFLNLYHLNTWLIMPATLNKKSSFVELVATQKQPPAWFVSHWWGEFIIDFMKCLTKHALTRDLNARALYWICAYANRQHVLSQDVTKDPKQSSFFKALAIASGVLLVLNEPSKEFGVEAAFAFKRTWCIFEESLAVDYFPNCKLDIAACHSKMPELLTDGVTPVDREMEIVTGGDGTTAQARRERTFPMDIIYIGLQLKVQDSEASQAEDKLHILNCLAKRDLDMTPVLQEHEHYHRVNRKLHALFARAAWRQALDHEKVSELKLPEAVCADTSRQKLHLNFRGSLCCKDHSLDEVVNGLHKDLESFDLDVSSCFGIGDQGVKSLSSKLVCLSKLKSLSLHFQHCHRVSDVGIINLATNLPTNLTSLVVNFGNCHKISDEGVISLFKALPRALRDFALNLESCKKVGPASMKVLGKHIPPKLSMLQLNVYQTNASDSIEALKTHLPASLRALQLYEGKWKESMGEGMSFTSGYADGSVEVKAHEFFRGVDWQAAYEKRIPPPFIPTLHNSGDVKYFDKEVLNIPVQNSEVGQDGKEVKHFEGFTYAGK